MLTVNTKNGEGENSKPSYRPEIDGLRALAVVAVIINHFNKDILPSGYLGVDIFFVISGFVITSSLAERSSNSFGDFLMGFYTRRIRRLVPPLVLFVIVTSVLICLFNPNPMFSLRTGITSLFGFSNLYLLEQSTNYFAASTEMNVFTHTWSLGVEEQFYFLFPFLLWFTGFSRFTAKGPRNLCLTIGVLSVSSLIAFVYLYSDNQSAAYFLMPTRFWELGAGCLLFLGLKHSTTLRRRLNGIPPLMVTTAIVVILFVPLQFAVPATIAVVGLTTVLIAGLSPGTAAYGLFTQSRVVYIGLISYSLYLWHWGIISISQWTIGIYWWSVPFQLGLILLISMASYHYIETPFRRSDRSILRWQLIGYGLGATASTAMIVTFLGNSIAHSIYLGNILKVETPENLRATWWRNLETGQYIERCHIELEYRRALLTECLHRKQADKPTLYVIGDSHARNYLIAVRNAFSSHQSVYLTIGYACAFFPPSLISREVESQTNCSDYAKDVAAYLSKETKKGDVVFIGQALAGDRGATPKYFNFIGKLASSLASRDVPVVLLDGTAPPPKGPEFCLTLPWSPSGKRTGCFTSKTEVKQRYSKFDKLAKSFVARHPNTFYIPLRDGLCVKKVCGQTTSMGTPIWHDYGGHITEKSSEELAPLLIKRLKKTSFSQRFPWIVLAK